MSDVPRCTRDQLNAVFFNAANSPCLRHGPDGRRCAWSAKGDLSWMCLTCQLRQLYYGPQSGPCGVCHEEGGPC